MSEVHLQPIGARQTSIDLNGFDVIDQTISANAPEQIPVVIARGRDWNAWTSASVQHRHAASLLSLPSKH
jgi:hypothetical protein